MCLILEELKHDKKFQYWIGFPNYSTSKHSMTILMQLVCKKRKTGET